jgi:hypothetical protein
MARSVGKTAGVAIGLAAVVAIAAGGGATAATLITSKQIKDNTIQSRDIRDGTIQSRDIRDGTIQSRDVSDGTLTSADIRDGTVGLKDVGSDVKGSLVGGRIPSGTTVTGVADWLFPSSVSGFHRFAVNLPGDAGKVLDLEDVNFATDANSRTIDDDSACTGSFSGLRLEHPAVLLDSLGDLDEQVLGDRVGLRDRVDPPPEVRGQARQRTGHRIHDVGVAHPRRRHLRQRRVRGDRGRATVGVDGEGGGPLGDLVGVRAGERHHLVELQVDAAEVAADDVPVRLLRDQAQVDQVDQGRLQRLAGDLLGIRREWARDWHGSTVGRSMLGAPGQAASRFSG